MNAVSFSHFVLKSYRLARPPNKKNQISLTQPKPSANVNLLTFVTVEGTPGAELTKHQNT